MAQYTHEMRWKNSDGILREVEYCYDGNTKILYYPDGRLVQRDFDIETFKRAQIKRKTSCWYVLEINVELENK